MEMEKEFDRMQQDEGKNDEGKQDEDNVVEHDNHGKESDTAVQEARKTLNGQDDSAKESGEKENRKHPFDDFSEFMKDINSENSNKNIFIQYRIENNHGVVAGRDVGMGDVYAEGIGRRSEEGRDKYAIVQNLERLGVWLSDNFGSFDMAFLIACAVFENMPYIWINEAAEKLYFQHGIDKEKKERALNQRLKEFGAELFDGSINTYTGKTKVDFICFKKKEYAKNVLRCVWKEFSIIRKDLVQWLQYFILGGKLQMSRRATEMIGFLAGLDYYFFANQLITQIIQANSIYNDMLLARTAIYLKEHEEFQEHIDNMVDYWSKSHNTHYLITVILVCIEWKEKEEELKRAVDRYVEDAFECCKKGKKKEEFFDFFAAGMRDFTFYRMLIDKLYAVYQDVEGRRGKKEFYVLFLSFVVIDIGLLDKDSGEEAILMRLSYVKNSVREKLAFLWQMLFQSNDYRSHAYSILGEYYFLFSEEKADGLLKKFLNGVFGMRKSLSSQNEILFKIKERYRRNLHE